MKCERTRLKLMPFLLGELPRREMERIARHVRYCTRCFNELDALHLTVRTLERLPREHPPAAFEMKLKHALRGTPDLLQRPLKPTLPRRPTRVLVLLGTTLALGALVACGYLAFWHRTPPLARIIRVTGRPEMRMRNAGGWLAAPVGRELAGAAAFRTGETDRAELELRGGSRVVVDFDTSAAVMAEPRRVQHGRRIRVQLSRGSVWLLVAKSDEAIVVETPCGVVESLGTIFQVSTGGTESPAGMAKGPQPEPQRTQVTVFRGDVKVSNNRGSVTVTEGAIAEAAADRVPRTARRSSSLAMVRLQVPWKETAFEVWVPPRLEVSDALRRVAGARRLGIRVTPVPMTLDGQPLGGPGLSVISVSAGSPAAAAGVRPGDILLGVGSLPMKGEVDVARAELLSRTDVRTELTVRRGGNMVRLRAPAGRPRGGASPQNALAEGNRLLAQGRVDKAGQQYQQAAEMRRNDPAALNNLGVVRELQHEIGDAERLYRSAVLLAPGVPLYRFNLAMALCRIGNLRAAVRQLEAALSLDRAFHEAAYALGRWYAFLGSYEAAADIARSLRSSGTAAAQGYRLAGEMQELRGDFAGAEASFLEAVGRDAFYVEAQTDLAAVYYVQGEMDAAERWAKRALSLSPDSLIALNRLGLVLIRKGLLDEAEQTLLKASASHPDSGETRNNLGLLYLKKQNLVASRATYRKAVALAPDNAACHLGLAVAYERSRNFAEAKSEYAAAIRLDPAYSDAYRRLASLHRTLGETRLARRVLTEARRFGA